MGSALEAVLALQQQKAQAAQQQSDNLTQGLQMLQQAQQQAKVNQLAQLQLKAGLAEKGLVSDSSTASGFKRDTSLMSPMDLLIQQGQAADANNKIMAAGGQGLNLFGAGTKSPVTIPQAPVGGAIGQVLNQPSSVAQTDPNQGMVASQTLNVAGVPTSTTIDYPNVKTANKMAEGVPQDKAGLYNLAKESVSNVDNIMSTLFPKGTPESFDRGAAFQSNTPNLKLPVIGQIGPSYIPTEKGQDIYRWTGNAIAARQLIQTGVAARPEETQRLLDAFAASGTSNAKSTFKGYKELKDFYVSFNHDLKTLGLDDLQKKYPGAKEYLKSQSNSQSEPASFANAAEAAKAGLADGTPITINGVKGKWSNK